MWNTHGSLQDGAPKIAKLRYKWLNSMVYGRYNELVNGDMGVISWFINQLITGGPHLVGPGSTMICKWWVPCASMLLHRRLPHFEVNPKWISTSNKSTFRFSMASDSTSKAGPGCLVFSQPEHGQNHTCHIGAMNKTPGIFGMVTHLLVGSKWEY